MEYKPLNEGLFERTLKEIYDSGKREIAVIAHATSLCDYVSPEKDKIYRDNNRIFLQECKKRGIPIIHFVSDNYVPMPVDCLGKIYMFLADGSGCPERCSKKCNEKPLEMESVFGLKADYEIPSFYNIGIPVDTKLWDKYTELKSIYNIYLPHSDFVFKRAIVTGRSTNRCHFVASEIIAPHTNELVVIPECTINKYGKEIDTEKYSEIATESLKFPSFMSMKDFLAENTKELFEEPLCPEERTNNR